MSSEKIPEQDLGGVLIEKTSSPEQRFRFAVEADWIDPNGHCNQRHIDNVMILAQAEFMEHHPFAVTREQGLELEKRKVYLKKKEIEFFREMKLGERGEVATIVTPGNTSVTFSQRIYNQRRELVAQATYVTVLVGEDGKPVPMFKVQKDAFVGPSVESKQKEKKS